MAVQVESSNNGVLRLDLPISGGQLLTIHLSHTCELNGANPFDYPTKLLQHSAELKQRPSEWMPWNYRDILKRLATLAAA